jgi:hypothetical protein
MVVNLYVDEGSRQLRFVDVLSSDFLGLQRYHPVPVEVVSKEDPGSITLRVNQETGESAPDFPNPTWCRTRSTSEPSANITATVSTSPNFHIAMYANFVELRTCELWRIFFLRLSKKSR